MKAIAGIFDTRENAIEAIDYLKRAGYPASQTIIVNKDELVHNHISIKPGHTIEWTEVILGAIIGLVTGTAMGMHVFDFRLLHFLYTSGMLLGAFTGAILGAWVSGIVAIITSVTTNLIYISKYEQPLNDGKYLLFVQGTRWEIAKARKVLHTPDLELELD